QMEHDIGLGSLDRLATVLVVAHVQPVGPPAHSSHLVLSSLFERLDQVLPDEPARPGDQYPHFASMPSHADACRYPVLPCHALPCPVAPCLALSRPATPSRCEPYLTPARLAVPSGPVSAGPRPGRSPPGPEHCRTPTGG